MEKAGASSGSQGPCSRSPAAKHQDTLAPEVPRMPWMSPQGTRLNLKSEHHSNSPYLCTLRVLISASCATCVLHSASLPKQGMRPCNGTILKSSVSASIPKSQTLAASQSQPSPAVAVAVVVWLLAVHETSVSGASECLVLIQELLLSSLA